MPAGRMVALLNFDGGNIQAVAQRADDARAVIDYIHDTTTHVVDEWDSVGTNDLCPAP